MKKIIILGGGGFAGEVLDTIEYINKNTEEKILPLGYVYGGAAKDKGKLIHDLPIWGELSCLRKVLSIFLCKIFIGQFFKERQIFAHFSHRV